MPSCTLAAATVTESVVIAARSGKTWPYFPKRAPVSGGSLLDVDEIRVVTSDLYRNDRSNIGRRLASMVLPVPGSPSSV
jgi:hypothetical protein